MWWENIQFLALEPHGEEQIKIKKKKNKQKQKPSCWDGKQGKKRKKIKFNSILGPLTLKINTS